MAEKPFKIDVPNSEVELLRKKLELARLPDELDEAGWKYGAPLTDVKNLVERWKTFDWKKYEEKINELPMYTRDIEVDTFGALNIHYIHQKSEVETAIPLLFIHGCTPFTSIFVIRSDDGLVQGLVIFWRFKGSSLCLLLRPLNTRVSMSSH